LWSYDAERPARSGRRIVPGFLFGVTGGQTLDRLGGLAEQLVNPECLAARSQ
jgi:hypothetical protein